MDTELHYILYLYINLPFQEFSILSNVKTRESSTTHDQK